MQIITIVTFCVIFVVASAAIDYLKPFYHTTIPPKLEYFTTTTPTNKLKRSLRSYTGWDYVNGRKERKYVDYAYDYEPIEIQRHPPVALIGLPAHGSMKKYYYDYDYNNGPIFQSVNSRINDFIVNLLQYSKRKQLQKKNRNLKP